MSDLFLTRASLRRDAPSSALRQLLIPSDDSARVAAGHRLVWTLFGDTQDRTRDFLWRESAPGKFYILSHRAPVDPHGLFDIDSPKLFEAHLRIGDRMQFALRANATVSRATEKGTRSKPHDVVMNALRATPSGGRADVRRRIIFEAGIKWLIRQGERHGFRLVRGKVPPVGIEASPDGEEPVAARVTAYRMLRVEHNGPSAHLGVLDYDGILEVTDPTSFLKAVGAGFGRAKAFGCGLMLIRRARERD